MAEELSVADRYRFFAWETRGSSALYERLSEFIASDEELQAFLAPLGPYWPQPTLFFASVNLLGGINADARVFRSFVLEHADEIAALMRTRTTQTNEVGRCATFLPILSSLPEPLALIEVGASAGLNLLLDRYAYDFGAGVIGDPSSSVLLRCELRGGAPSPGRVPEVVWRKGIDLAPVDVRDEDATSWLEACVWADQTERLERLRGAIEIARREPPEIVRGDLIDEIQRVVAEAPSGSTVVVFHSAVLAYLEAERRQVFADLVRSLRVVWVASEGPSVVPGVKQRIGRKLPTEITFVQSVDGEPKAFVQPHGAWLEWL